MIFLRFILSIYIYAVLSCIGNPEETAGVVETGNTSISGVIKNSEGVYGGVIVKLHSAKLTLDPIKGTSEWPILYDTTDHRGHFNFSLPQEFGDDLVVEGYIPDSNQAIRHHFLREGRTMIQLGNLLLKTTSNLEVNVIFPGNLEGSVGVQVIGTNRFIQLDSGETQYQFTRMAQGRYFLKYWGMNPARDTITSDSAVELTEIAQAIDIPFPIQVLIVDGINNHDWNRLTTSFVQILERAGLFEVNISTTPPEGSPISDWDIWRPLFGDYNVVLCNYNGNPVSPTLGFSGNRWPTEVEVAFESFIANGGGLVNLHSTFPGFGNWSGFQEMKGLEWKSKDLFPGLFIDSTGILDTLLVGEGSQPMEYDEEIVVETYGTHVINEDLPTQWLHAMDGLAYGLRGGIGNIEVLAYTLSSNTQRGEPIAWVNNYGQGRVFTSILGHLGVGDPDDNLRCIGFQTYLIRGMEWAGTGNVSYPVPQGFPSSTEIILSDPFK